ncbi:hypothetical protein R3P38DRAFT_2865361 [Favolaschia claudopus]|uniref:Uncharacterized protein n=1 Tax=Favolaschia claudopus TaxID=2862362 RepID=A0AAW0DGD0_9AGAR
MNADKSSHTLPINLFPANTSSSDPKSIHLASHNINVIIPETVSAAEELLHFVSVHRNVCMSEEMMLRQRLHHSVLFLQVLQQQIDAVSRKRALADQDLGSVSAALRMSGPPGTRLVPPECETCDECRAMREEGDEGAGEEEESEGSEGSDDDE